MPHQSKQPFFGLLVLTLFIICASTYTYLHQNGYTKFFDDVAINAQGGIQQRFYFLGLGLRSIMDRYLALVSVKEENEHLKKEMFELNSKLVRLRESELENERLRKILPVYPGNRIPLFSPILTEPPHSIHRHYRSRR